MDLTSTVLWIIFDNSCLILHGIAKVQLHQITLYVAYINGRIAYILATKKTWKQLPYNI